MATAWNDFTYLARGSPRQRAAWRALEALELVGILSEYHPILAGTIPLDIDIEGSDLDIICEVYDPQEFERRVTSAFGTLDNFQIRRKPIDGRVTVIARFTFQGFPVEIFGQPRPVTDQNAYRHMEIEARLLAIGGEEARHEIRRLKRAGLKTEPAFGRYFRLTGDPYQRLLALALLDERELRAAFGNWEPGHNAQGQSSSP